MSRAFSIRGARLPLMHTSSILFFVPRGHLINLWHKIFLTACLLSLFTDWVFLYLTEKQQQNMCIEYSSSSTPWPRPHALHDPLLRYLVEVLEHVQVLPSLTRCCTCSMWHTSWFASAPHHLHCAMVVHVQERRVRYPASQDRQHAGRTCSRPFGLISLHDDVGF
jgi:hypothetical protein